MLKTEDINSQILIGFCFLRRVILELRKNGIYMVIFYKLQYYPNIESPLYYSRKLAILNAYKVIFFHVYNF